MPRQVKPRSSYRSPLREEQARETRRRILEAARRLFVEQGYASTSIVAIAEAAGVAPETVYAVFSNKCRLLQHVIGATVRGDEDPRPLLERARPQAMRRAPTQKQQLRLFARGVTEILERVGPLFEVMASAAQAEPEIDALRREFLNGRVHTFRVIVEWLTEKGSLRAGLSLDMAAETVNAITSPHVYGLLTRDRGWSRQRYVDWLAQTLEAALLPPGAR